MSEMIERVAFVLFSDGVEGCEELWRLASETTREHYSRRARRAIEAMREPTAAMMGAIDCDGDKRDWSSGRFWLSGWRAMIDAALKE